MKKLILIPFILLSILSYSQTFIGTGNSTARSLIINASGAGSGTVTTDDNFINCVDSSGVITGLCNHSYSGSPAVIIRATAGANTTVSYANGSGSASSCNGSSTGTIICNIPVFQANSTLGVIFTTPANSAIPGQYTGIDMNSLSTGCPPSGGHYPFNIHHALDRWWDLKQVQWSYVNTAVDTYDWTNVDSMGCAAAQNGSVIHWTMSRTPYFATNTVQHTDAGDCSYFTSTNSITSTSSPTKVNSVGNSDGSGNIIITTDTVWTGVSVGNKIVIADVSPAGINGLMNVNGFQNSGSVTYTVCCAAPNTTVTNITNVTISLVTDTRGNAPNQCDPPSDINIDGTGTNQIWRDWVGAAAAHVNNPTALAGQTMAHVKIWEPINEPDTCQFFSCVYGSYDIQSRYQQDMYCIIKGGAYYVSGGMTTRGSTPFGQGQTVTQAVTGATAVLMGGLNYPSDLLNFQAAPTGSPDNSHTWSNGGGGASIYTPNITPTQMTIRATGETCQQVRNSIPHGAGSPVVDTNIFPNFPSLPIDTTATVIMGSFHPPDTSAKQTQAALYCNVLPGGVSATKEVCSSNTTTCGGASTTPCCQLSGTTYKSCHSPALALVTEGIDEHYKPGPVVTTPSMETAMVTAIGQINAILGTAELAKPLLLSEAGYSSCGWPSIPPSTTCDPSSPWGILEMEAAFVSDYYIYTYTLANIPENVWYAYTFSTGGIGTACTGSPNFCANEAMDTVYQWITSGVISPCTITNGAGTNSLYTCPIVTTYPDGASRTATIYWDNAELCTGTNGSHGTCPTTNMAIDNSYTKCWTVNNSFTLVSGHQTAVGVLPQMCGNFP